MGYQPQERSLYVERKILTLSMLIMMSNVSQAAVATANATSNVIAAISITKISDLVFGNGAPGEAAKVIAAGTSENASNASFTVAGQPVMKLWGKAV
jgi:hypothetical protein